MQLERHVESLEGQLRKSKKTEILLQKKILRLENLAYHNNNKNKAVFMSIDTNLENLNSVKHSQFSTQKNGTLPSPLPSEKKYLTPHNKSIISNFHSKPSIFRFSPCLTKKMQVFEKSPLNIEILTENFKENIENSEEKTVSHEEMLIEKVKSGAVEVILERDQKIFELSQQINEKEKLIDQNFIEMNKLKRNFAKIYEELLFENEEITKKMGEEKQILLERIQELEQQGIGEKGRDQVLIEQLESYQRHEIMLCSELDERKGEILTLEKENFSLGLQLLEKDNEIMELTKQIQQLKTEFSGTSKKNREVLDLNEKKFEEKCDILNKQNLDLEAKNAKLFKENILLRKEKQEISIKYEEIKEEKFEIEKVFLDLKEFHRTSTEKYEEIIRELRDGYKVEINTQKEELEKLKLISIDDEKFLNNENLLQQLGEKYTKEDLDIKETKEIKEEEIYKKKLEILNEEMKYLEDIVIETKLQAAEAFTDRDYFHFKYKQSLEFIKGMTIGIDELNGKPKENFRFFKELVKKFWNNEDKKISEKI